MHSSQLSLIKKCLVIGLSLLALPLAHSQEDQIPYWLTEYEELYRESPREASTAWFREAKLGLMVHYNTGSLLERGKTDYLEWTSGKATDRSLKFVGYTREEYEAAKSGKKLSALLNQKYYEKLGFDKKAAGFYGMIDHIDVKMGEMFEKLEEWDLLENTIIIFTSDNGMTRIGCGLKSFEGRPHKPPKGVKAPAYERDTWNYGKPIGTTIPDGPITRGFDHFLGFHHSRTMSSMTKDDTVTEYVSVRDTMGHLTDAVVAHIAEQSESEQPFFIHYPMNSPHAPVAPTDEWKGKGGIEGDYPAFVAQTDDAVGQVLRALEKYKLKEDTIVIFGTDNGCHRDPALYLDKGHSVSGPLRGMKKDTYDGGHRIPFIVRWAGVVESGMKSSAARFFEKACRRRTQHSRSTARE